MTIRDSSSPVWEDCPLTTAPGCSLMESDPVINESFYQLSKIRSNPLDLFQADYLIKIIFVVLWKSSASRRRKYSPLA